MTSIISKKRVKCRRHKANALIFFLPFFIVSSLESKMSQPINFELLLNQLFGRFENTFEDQNDHQDREQERISPPHVQFDSFLEEGVLLTPLEWSDSDSRVDEER